ncbi:MAG: dephospho-CoA kinase [Phycisphaerales bacterium]
MNQPPDHSDTTSAASIIIGLCGAIAAGKSTVAELLAASGCVVVDSDALSRAALKQPDVKETLHAWWGPAVFDDDGNINRAVVAGIVFSDPAERARLEALVHPRVEAARRAVFAAAQPGTPALVIDAPLLFEAGIDRECDAVIFVDAPLPLRQERVKRDRGWTSEELARREAVQIPLDLKRRRADYHVSNDGNRAALKMQVAAVLEEIIRRGPTRSSAVSPSPSTSSPRSPGC